MKGMEKPIDKETAKYNAVAEISGLLRDTTKKKFVLHDPQFSDNMYAAAHNRVIPDEDLLPKELRTEYYNIVFSPEEHETVKRAFLRLISEL